MPRSPLASVVMPYYNNAAHLHAAVESYLRQTVDDFELILVDDGSTDASRAIVAGFRDARLVEVRSRVNRGISAAYNEALSKARSRCVIFAGADDVGESDRVAAVLAASEGQADGIVVSDVAVIDGAGQPTGAIYGFPEWVTSANVLIETLKRNYFLGAAMAVIGHPELRLDPALPAGDDFDVAVRLLVDGAGWTRVPRPLVQYRVHGGNFSRDYRRMKAGAEAVLRRYDIGALRALLVARGHGNGEADLAAGIVALFLGRSAEAECYLSAPREEESQPPRLALERRFYQGVASWRQGRGREALDRFAAALEIAPADAASANNVAALGALLDGEREASVQRLEEVLERLPTYLDARHNLEQLRSGSAERLRVTERLLPPVLLHGATYLLADGTRALPSEGH